MRNLFEMLAERHGNSDGYDSLYGLTAHSYTRMHTLCYTYRDGSESSGPGPGQECAIQ